MAGAGADRGEARLVEPAVISPGPLPRLGRRQGVLAAGLDQLLGDREAHEHAPDIVLRVPVSEHGEDRGLVPGHAVGEQRQHVGGYERDHGVDVGGGHEARRHGGGRVAGTTAVRSGRRDALGKDALERQGRTGVMLQEKLRLRVAQPAGTITTESG
jgi:hypothetical protein